MHTLWQVTQLGELLQYLTWLFLPGPAVRKMLGAPPPVKVDYRWRPLDLLLILSI